MVSFLANLISAYLVFLNLAVFFMMGYDKRQAIHHKWRVPEVNILFLALIGGGIGGLLARRMFHHKTRKPRFLVFFLFGSLLAIGLLIYCCSL